MPIIRFFTARSIQNVRNACFFSLLFLCLIAEANSQSAQTPKTEKNRQNDVKIVEQDDHLAVSIDGKPFTEYRHKGLRKPILFPIYGPDQTPMTRSYPMIKGVKNESNDHPHHQSLWFTHGKVNGTDFWISSNSRKGTKAKIQTETLKFGKNWIRSQNKWVNGNGDVICKDVRKMTFGKTKTGDRFIDFQIEISSDDQRVVFGDTKEGTMAIRVHPMLRLTADKKRGTTEVSGKAINSEGVTGRKIWGKRAKWVAYWGRVDQKEAGVAIFDHNKNLRHPTWWHARHYGLVGANPFGIHDFERKEKGAGDFVLNKGQKLTLNYRFLFFRGSVDSKEMEESYQSYLKKGLH